MNARKTKQERAKRQAALSDTGEEKVADALTIIWMLSAVATLAAQFVAGFTRALVLFSGDNAAPQMISRVLPGWFFVCSILTGITCLILTPVAYAVRRTKPPLSIMIAAVLIGALPLVALVIIQFMGE